MGTKPAVRHRSPKAPQPWKPIILIACVLSALVFARIFHLGDKVGELQGWIKSLGAWGPVVYTLIYIVAVVAALPGTAATFLAGVLFGSVMGLVVSSVGSTVGAALCFLIARYFARDAVAAWAAKNEKFRELDELTARKGGLIVAVVRLIPFIPFNLLNYGFGLTRVDFWEYVFYSWLCMLPATALFVVGADTFTQALTTGQVPWALIAAAVVITGLLVFLANLAKKKLNADGKPVRNKDGRR